MQVSIRSPKITSVGQTRVRRSRTWSMMFLIVTSWKMTINGDAMKNLIGFKTCTQTNALYQYLHCSCQQYFFLGWKLTFHSTKKNGFVILGTILFYLWLAIKQQSQFNLAKQQHVQSETWSMAKCTILNLINSWLHDQEVDFVAGRKAFSIKFRATFRRGRLEA